MKTMINIKADRDVKKKAQKVASDLGMPLSTVINAYLRQFIRTKAVYFSTGETEGELKPSVQRRLERLSRDMDKGKNLSRPLRTAKEMDEYLNSLR